MLPRFISIFLLVLLVSARAVEFSTVEIAGKRVTVCRGDVRKKRLQLFHRDGNGQPFKRFPALADWLGLRGAVA
ncbi:MAG: hypothetical protein ABIP85_25040 [Chthoniobacteraceae bacterium]